MPQTLVQPSADDVLEDGLSFRQFRLGGVQDLLKDVVFGGEIGGSNRVKGHGKHNTTAILPVTVM